MLQKFEKNPADFFLPYFSKMMYMIYIIIFIISNNRVVSNSFNWPHNNKLPNMTTQLHSHLIGILDGLFRAKNSIFYHNVEPNAVV